MLRSDIPFARDDANRFLPWMIALMCGITALMLCVGLSFGQWVQGRQGLVNANVTVQIPATSARQAQALLEKTPGVKAVRLLEEPEVRAMVEPWLGHSDAIAALTLPAVLDLVTVPGKTPDYAALEKQLKTLSADATLDTQQVWVAKFTKLSGIIQTGMYALALAVIGALAGMMVFTARTAMKLHAGTVHLLHAIGAEDGYIARQFQANALGLALRGAAPGTVGAGLLYGMLGFYATQADVPFMPGILLSLNHCFMLALLAVACCAISVVSVRVATLAKLKTLP